MFGSRASATLTFCLLLVFSFLGDSEESSEADVVRTYRLRSRRSRDLVEVLAPIFPDCRFHPDDRSNSVIVEGSPDRLQPLEEAVRSLDASRPEIGLTVHLLWGKKSNLRVPLPKEIEGAEAELRRRFDFGRYDRANKVFLPSLEESVAKAMLFPDHFFECAVDRVESSSGTADLRINVSRLSRSGDRIRTLLETGLRVRDGVPVVLGGVPAQEGADADLGGRVWRDGFDHAMILLLTAEIRTSEDSHSRK